MRLWWLYANPAFSSLVTSEDAGEDGDGLAVLGEVEVFVGGVVQAGPTISHWTRNTA